MTGPLLPPGARVEHVAHAGGRVRLLRGGPDSGVPLVLVHGGGPDNAGISWHGVFDALARTRPVLALDLPGSGRTEGIPVDGSPAAMADLAAAVVVAVAGPGPAVWVGVSMGGHVVLHVALRHPAAVAGLVLVAPGGLTAHAGGRFLHPLAWLACRLPDAVLLPAARLAGRFTRAAAPPCARWCTTPRGCRPRSSRRWRGRPAAVAWGTCATTRPRSGRGGCATT